MTGDKSENWTEDFSFGQQISCLEEDAAVGFRLGYFFFRQPSLNLEYNWKMTIQDSSRSALIASFYHIWI